MRYRFFLSLSAAAVLCLTTAAPARAQAEATFAKANADYAAGHFAQAVKGYQALVEGHHWSASVFYDLGNAQYRTGDFGHAILNYQRALALAPTQPEAQANLRLARDKARALELAPSWAEEHLAFLSLDQYALIAAVAFWGAAFVLAFLLFARRWAVVWIFALVLLCAIGGGAVFAITVFENGRSGRDFAIVTGNKVQARLATAESAGTVLSCRPGARLKS